MRQDTRLRAMSLSLMFAVLLICGVAALGLVLLIMLIRLIFRAARASRLESADFVVARPPFRQLSRCRSSSQRTSIRI